MRGLINWDEFDFEGNAKKRDVASYTPRDIVEVGKANHALLSDRHTTALNMIADALCGPSSGTLCVVGRPGSGKTELIKSISRLVNGDEVGSFVFGYDLKSPPGSISDSSDTWDTQISLLHRKSTRFPYGLMVVDEIEKAHHHMQSLLAEIALHHAVTSSWQRIDFAKTSFVMITNVLCAEIEGFIGSNGDDTDTSSMIRNLYIERGVLDPRLANAIRHFVYWPDITVDMMRKLVVTFVEQQLRQHRSVVCSVDVSESAAIHIRRMGIKMFWMYASGYIDANRGISTGISFDCVNDVVQISFS